MFFSSLLLVSHYFSEPTPKQSSSSKRGRRPTQHVCLQHLEGAGHTNPMSVRVAVAVRAVARPSGAALLALRFQRPIARHGTSRQIRNRGRGRACEHVDGSSGSRSSKALLGENRTKRCLRGDDRGRDSHCHGGEIRDEEFRNVRGGVDDSCGVLKDGLYFEGSGGGAAHRAGGFRSRDDVVVCACESDGPDDDASETERKCDGHCDPDALLDGQRATANRLVLKVAGVVRMV
jgi:hypothetical protein